MKRILITGVTGIIGSAIAPLFLNNPQTHVYLLVRVKAGEHPEERLTKLWQFWADDITAADARSRLTLIHSNHLDQPILGINPIIYEELSRKLTHIIHCAGSINLNMPDDIAKKNTYLITEQVVELARLASQHNFKKLDYVSTVGVAGREISPVPETPLLNITDYQNNYEKYKAEAERLLLKDSLPFAVTIHRPSMVVGNSKTGKIISFKGVYYLMSFFAGEFTYGIIPNINLKMDMVPVDYVANAIYWSSATTLTNHKILHLCAGEENCMPIRNLIHSIQTIKKDLGQKCFSTIPIPSFLFWKLLSFIKLLILHQNTRKFLGNLGVFATYFDQPQRFSVDKTRILLAQGNIIRPPTEQFLYHVLKYYYLTKEHR